MAIETGFELLDAIINNPIQSIIFLSLFYVSVRYWRDYRFRRMLHHNIKDCFWNIDSAISTIQYRYNKLNPQKQLVIFFMILIPALSGQTLLTLVNWDYEKISSYMMLGVTIFCLTCWTFISIKVVKNKFYKERINNA